MQQSDGWVAAWVDDDDKKWDEEGKVFCMLDYQTSDDINSKDISIHEEPPLDCHYRLELLMKGQI